jgi:hypothetical protein
MSTLDSLCGTCRFAVGYQIPDPLPAPRERRALFGLIRWTEGPCEWDESEHNYLTKCAEQRVLCRRYPKPRDKAKSATCGEWAA